MSLSPVNAGGWDPEEVLTSNQMNALQAELLRAIDGVGGGSYELAGNLDFDGAEIQISNILRVLISGFITVDSGGTLAIANGGVLGMSGQMFVGATGDVIVQSSGTITLQSGASLTLQGTATMSVAGPVDFLATSDVDLNTGAIFRVNGDMLVPGGGLIQIQNAGELEVTNLGRIELESGAVEYVKTGAKILGSLDAEIKVFDAKDLTINNSSVVFRLSLIPLFVEESTPGNPDWVPEIDGTWLMATAAGGHIVFPLPLRVGDVITTLRMTINGSAGPGTNHGTNPADMPAIELIKVDANGVTTSVQTAVDLVTGASYGSVHSVTLSGGLFPYTVTSDVHYVRVLAEGPDGGIANATRLCSIDGTLLAKSFRGANEVY